MDGGLHETGVLLHARMRCRAFFSPLLALDEKRLGTCTLQVPVTHGRAGAGPEVQRVDHGWRSIAEFGVVMPPAAEQTDPQTRRYLLSYPTTVVSLQIVLASPVKPQFFCLMPGGRKWLVATRPKISIT
jgi:hypothetical protein